MDSVQSPDYVDTNAVIKVIENLSVLVIMYPGKWPSDQFLPNCHSKRVIDWFEGTGTVIGIKRNRVFILSSIHCTPSTKFTFFVKGALTEHKQVAATLVENYFVVENNGIDVAVFSCDSSCFDSHVLADIGNIQWRCPEAFRIGSPVWLVHYPTSSEPEGVASTHRLFNECFPTLSEGVLLSEDFPGLTIDSTIIATGGSSGGLLVDENGYAVAVHDSQHDETPNKVPVSTHRMISELREAFKNNKQLHNLLYN